MLRKRCLISPFNSGGTKTNTTFTFSIALWKAFELSTLGVLYKINEDPKQKLIYFSWRHSSVKCMFNALTQFTNKRAILAQDNSPGGVTLTRGGGEA